MAWSGAGPTERPVKVGFCVSSRGGASDEFVMTFAMLVSECGTSKELLTERFYRIDVARNLLVERALAAGCTHVFFIDNDVYPFLWENGSLGRFYPQTVQHFLGHRYPIVAGLYWCKEGAWNFKTRDHNDRNLLFDVKVPLESIAGREHYFSATTTGLVLVDSRVFEAIEYPWFEYKVTGGRGEPKSEVSEDYGFFFRAEDAGFPTLGCTFVVGKHEGREFRLDETRSSYQVDF